MHRVNVRLAVLTLAGALAAVAAYQPALTAQGMQSLTFDEAIRRALVNNPTVQEAVANVLRAQGILQQVRSQSLPTIDVSFSTNVIEPVTQFSGSSIVPRGQTLTGASVGVPLYVPVRWAQRDQAADQVLVAERTADNARRQVAMATAEVYLRIIGLRRVLDAQQQALDNAQAHYDYANQRFLGGIGSRLNALRAQQEVSADQARVETARFEIARAQEALGVLVAADGPVDASEEPSFDVPAPAVADRELIYGRQDIRAILTRQAAADRVANDSWKDFLPSVTALFTNQYLLPSGLFSQSQSLRGAVLFNIPIFEGGNRRGLARERVAVATAVRLERENAERQATSEIRVAREAIAASERALEYTRLSAMQANEVVSITDIVFREGATTNIELIDAQRRARDADTAAAVAEDALRRANLDLLIATGRFPQ